MIYYFKWRVRQLGLTNNEVFQPPVVVKIKTYKHPFLHGSVLPNYFAAKPASKCATYDPSKAWKNCMPNGSAN